MQVCEEIISYPFVKYSVNVSHVTSRKSTAFEWLFLEALIKSSETDFKNENLDDFFKKFFLIDNPEKLIKPVLKKLYDLQALSCEKLNDDTPLSQLIVSDIVILPLGKEMQSEGLLPGEHSENKLDIVFDVSQKKLIWDKNKFSNEAQGNYVQIDEVDFPERLVREFLESQRPHKKHGAEESSEGEGTASKKKKKNQKKIDWLSDNTEIDSVYPSKKEMCFDNISREVHLKDGLIWKIESNKVVELEEASLENFENPVPEIFLNCPMTTISKPDEQITQIILFKDLEKRVQKHLQDYRTSIVLESLFKNEKQSGKKANKSNNKKEHKTLILFGAQLFSFDSEDGKIIVKIPQRILPPNCVFMNESIQINAEKFPVRAGNVHRELPFAYLPKNTKPNLRNFLLPIVREYYRTEPKILLLLSEENGLNNEFQQFFEKLVSSGSAKEKAEKINALNDTYQKLSGKKCISDETIFDLLINPDEIKKSVSDFSSAKDTIEEYALIPAVKNQVLRDFLKIVLDQLNPTDSLEQIWTLLDSIEQKSPDAIGFLDKQRSIGRLYSQTAKNEIFEKAFSQNLKSARCDFERRALNLSEIFQKIRSEKNERKMKELSNSWKTNFANLVKNYGNIEIAEKFNSEILSLIGGKK